MFLAKPVIVTYSLAPENPEGLHLFRYTSVSMVLQMRAKPKKREQCMSVNLTKKEARTLAERLLKLADELV